MHDIPRKDREDADDVDEDEVAEVSGGISWTDPDGGCIPIIPGYPPFPGGTPRDPPEPGDPPYPVTGNPYLE